jgi:hypothetical protein
MEDKIFKKRCSCCRDTKPAYLFIRKGIMGRICKACHDYKQFEKAKLRASKRRAVLRALAREMKIVEVARDKANTTIIKTLDNTLRRINTVLNAYGYPNVKVYTSVDAVSLNIVNNTLKDILSQYLKMTSVNRNHLNTLKTRAKEHSASQAHKTSAAIQRREQLQILAVEALRLSITEFLAGGAWYRVRIHYEELVSGME